MRKPMTGVAGRSIEDDGQTAVIDILGSEGGTSIQGRTSAASKGMVVTGMISGFDRSGAPIVTFGGGGRTRTAVARRTISLRQCRRGGEVVLILDSITGAPIIIGVLQDQASCSLDRPDAIVDGERIVLNADKEIVLK